MNDNIKRYASEDYVDSSIANIVNSAPETLNTLNELAVALGNDENFATTVATQIGTKVDKIDGKELSTNDYTTAEKTKLSKVLTTDNTTAYIPSSEYHPSTKKYVDDSVAGVVNAAPETLATLNQLAEALGNDENFAVTVATQIGKKVDKEAGKGLSANDYTNEEKLKLSKVLTTDNTTEYEPISEFNPATKKYVDTTVAEVVNSSPETLAALQELSAALEEDANLSASLSTQIGNKVDKVEGMGLSSNDYDSETKTFVDTLKTKNLATQEIIDLHLTDVSNPHIVTKAQIGLSNVDNVKQYSETNPPPYPVTSINGQTGTVTFATEEWTFTLSDGSTVTKKVMLG